MMKKYKFFGGTGFPLNFTSAAVEMQKKPVPSLSKHLILPENTTEDILTFTAKYVESFANLNRAWFDNEELIKAYASIPFKAVDVEHELDKIIGHIHTHAYIDRSSDKIITPEEFLAMDEDPRKLMNIDVLIGGVAYVDRFPNIEGPLSTKALKVSMECYFSSFDILLENGVKFTLEEAISLGMEEWVDQLMGPHASKEDFDKAHTLKVLLADNKQYNMGVYKYLKDIIFSGAGAVLNPACESCWILTTDRDEEEACSCGGQMAASTKSDIKLYELDLNKVEAYKKMKREQEKSNQVQVPNLEKADDVNTQVPPGGPTPDPVSTDTNLVAPTICPQYKERIYDGNADPLAGSNEVLHENWCAYAEKGCEVAGNRQDKGCFRWVRDPNGDATDLYDTRNFAPDVAGPQVDETLSEEDYNVAKRSFASLVKYHELTLKKIEQER